MICRPLRRVRVCQACLGLSGGEHAVRTCCRPHEPGCAACQGAASAPLPPYACASNPAPSQHECCITRRSASTDMRQTSVQPDFASVRHHAAEIATEKLSWWHHDEEITTSGRKGRLLRTGLTGFRISFTPMAHPAHICWSVKPNRSRCDQRQTPTITVTMIPNASRLLLHHCPGSLLCTVLEEGRCMRHTLFYGSAIGSPRA